MKRLLLCLLLAGCTSTETFGPDGKRTSRTSTPSPELWTNISGAVATFGAQSVAAWAKQISDQQKWERGEK